MTSLDELDRQFNQNWAKDWLKEAGYINDQGQYQFGNADSHLLRAVYVLAAGLRVLGPKESLNTIITLFQQEDGPCEKKPPWKK